MGRLLQRLVLCLAFASALVVPLLFAATARAAILPACEERDGLTRMPVEWLPPAVNAEPTGDDACTRSLPAPIDDQGDVKVAAMCDARGASIIAPPRILSIVDARIEAAAGRASDHASPALLRPGRSSHGPVGAGAPALADHAVLDAAVIVSPASSAVGPGFAPVVGGPRCGVARGIDHPPR